MSHGLSLQTSGSCATEPLQVVRYNVGEYYRDHFDNKEGVAVIKRAATLIMYLTDVQAGGATHFPKAAIINDAGQGKKGCGIRITPRQVCDRYLHDSCSLQ